MEENLETLAEENSGTFDIGDSEWVSEDVMAARDGYPVNMGKNVVSFEPEDI